MTIMYTQTRIVLGYVIAINTSIEYFIAMYVTRVFELSNSDNRKLTICDDHNISRP